MGRQYKTLKELRGTGKHESNAVILRVKNSSKNGSAHVKKMDELIRDYEWSFKHEFKYMKAFDSEAARVFNETTNEIVFVFRDYCKNETEFRMQLQEAEYYMRYEAASQRTGLRYEQLAFLEKESKKTIVFPVVCFRRNAKDQRWWIWDYEEEKYNVCKDEDAKAVRAGLVAQYAVDLAKHQQDVTGEQFLVFDADTINGQGEVKKLTLTNYGYNEFGEPYLLNEVVRQDADHKKKTGVEDEDGSVWVFDPDGEVLFNRKVNPVAYNVVLPYRCIKDGIHNVTGDLRPGYIKNQAGYGESPLLPKDQRVSTKFGSSGYREAMENLVTNLKEI